MPPGGRAVATCSQAEPELRGLIKSIELDRIKVKGKEELITIYKPVINLMEGYDFTSTEKVTTNSKKDNKK